MKYIVVFTLVVSLDVTIAQAKDYHVYFLGGQSNMVGFGKRAELDTKFHAPVEGVMIFQGRQGMDQRDTNRGGRGMWSTLRPGHGNWFYTDGKRISFHREGIFGPELFFGIRIQQLYPDRNIALIKYARNGTSIAVEAAGKWGCWYPDYTKGNGINQWDHALATIKNARAIQDIDGDDEPDKFIPAGIVWMQGESDAQKTEAVAKSYSANLKAVMDAIRKEFGADVPVAIGRISNSSDAKAKGLSVGGREFTWRHGEILRAQQAAFVEQDASAALVTSTDNYGYSDGFHYNSAGFKDLGIQFAEAIKKLSEAK